MFINFRYFPFEMATLRNKKKLAAVAGESLEERPRNNHSRDTTVLRIHED